MELYDGGGKVGREDLGMERRKKSRHHQLPTPFCLQLHCCGFNNYTDFNSSRFVKENKVFPPFCCANNTDSHTVEPCTEDKAKSMNVQVCAGVELAFSFVIRFLCVAVDVLELDM